MIRSEFSHQKPADFGAAGVTGSIDADGRLIALNVYDAAHGYITLTSAQSFRDRDRYNPAKVRAYRAALPHLAGFGVHFDKPVAARTTRLSDDILPLTTLHFAHGQTAQIATLPIGSGAAQHISLPNGITAHWAGKISLQRCAYTQLTEGGVLLNPLMSMQITVKNNILTIYNPALKRAMALLGLGRNTPLSIEVFDGVSLNLKLAPQPNIMLIYQFAETPEEAAHNAAAVRDGFTSTSLPPPSERIQPRTDDLLAKRGILYGHQMCVPVGEGICILTDHMLLPLSWNRDAYFVALALLHGSDGGADLVRRHLIWMFEIAERPNDEWGRCHLTNGKIKDKAYQLDQQLYPVLELADYVAHTGDTALLARLRPTADKALAALVRHRSLSAALYATEETPGDDPIAQPYHLSSHILLWYTLKRYGEITGDEACLRRAETVRAAIAAHFVTQDAAGSTLYAYAVDGKGGTHLYHDANDVPLALAPLWGFCAPDDAIWQATVRFAFSAENGAFYSHRLGSVHTPAPWPLGDLQDVIIARALNDEKRQQAAWARLRRSAATDGALPEACDPDTGEVVSRTWFAWPNALAACIQTGAWT